MTYLDEEAGGLDPIELFEFTVGAEVFRYTDSDGLYVHPVTGDVYSPVPISRGAMQQSEEDNSMAVDVIIDVIDDVAQFFRTPFLPVYQIWVTIWRTHAGSTAVATLFRGRAGQCTFEGTTAKLTCVPMRAALSKRIPVQLVQALCNNTLYDERCQANPELFKEEATIVSVDGLTLTVTWGSRDVGKPEGYFDGGYIVRVGAPAATVLNDTLSLNTVKILYNPGFLPGDPIMAYAGCDKRYATCRDKFANTEHHQGYPYFPAQDPFANEVL
jgi:uncharacterized phage protein (TIGR02218 family)